MFDARVRSLNLANAASIAVYEAIRQLGVSSID
jgi:tRNA(Leu) C34 or U34 (ribose-2'-O)-methylase TrmL